MLVLGPVTRRAGPTVRNPSLATAPVTRCVRRSGRSRHVSVPRSFNTTQAPAAHLRGALRVHCPHAEPYYADATPNAYDGQRVGVLLHPGFHRVAGVDGALGPSTWPSEGLGVAVPRLPGHGTTWQELNRTRWADWYGEVERSFEKLRANCDQVVVGGLSMGGALALRLAADRGREVAGIVLVNPAVNTERKDVLALPVLKHVVPAFPGIANDIKKPGVEEYGYTRTPLRAAHSMMTGLEAAARGPPEGHPAAADVPVHRGPRGRRRPRRG